MTVDLLIAGMVIFPQTVSLPEATSFSDSDVKMAAYCTWDGGPKVTGSCWNDLHILTESWRKILWRVTVL